MSCPRLPLLSSSKLKPVASFKESIRLIVGLLLFLLPSNFPSVTAFSAESLPSPDVPNVRQPPFRHFGLWGHFRLSLI